MIRSRHNERLKDIRRFRRCKGDEAVLEGPHLVAEAHEAGCEILFVLATEAFFESRDGAALVSRLGQRIVLVDPELLDSVADSDSPRGIVAAARLPRGGVEAIAPEARLVVYAEGVQDPGNVGALARVAEAAGATALALGPGTAHPNHPRALRASAGSLLRLPTAMHVSPGDVRERLRDGEATWINLVPRGGRSVWRPFPAGSLVVAIGAEGLGLSPTTLAQGDAAMTIPLAAPVESLNTTVAAAVALFELRRQRREVSAEAAPRPGRSEP